MAEKHDALVSKYKNILQRKKYLTNKKSNFVDYRPDLYAVKNKEEILVEAEIESSIQNEHTLTQLELMYQYLSRKKTRKGILLVPKKSIKEAEFLIYSVFGDKKIEVVGL